MNEPTRIILQAIKIINKETTDRIILAKKLFVRYNWDCATWGGTYCSAPVYGQEYDNGATRLELPSIEYLQRELRLKNKPLDIKAD